MGNNNHSYSDITEQRERSFFNELPKLFKISNSLFGSPKLEDLRDVKLWFCHKYKNRKVS